MWNIYREIAAWIVIAEMIIGIIVWVLYKHDEKIVNKKNKI